MVLNVPFEGFAEAMRAHTGAQAAFLSTLGIQTVVTAADPAKGVILRSSARMPLAAARAALESAGVKVHEGSWGEVADGGAPLWVAAVAYRSSEDTPGLWVDTFETKPTTGQVLSELYEEFRETGEVGDVSMEEFIRLADPNVVVLSPEEQAEFARRTRGCE